MEKPEIQPQSQYFPYEDFEPWFRQGLTAADILNKLLVASYPDDQRPDSPQPVTNNEELRLLDQVAAETPHQGYRQELRRLIGDLQFDGGNYPHLGNERARTVWLALTGYGTSSESYRKLHLTLSAYFASIADPDQWVEGCLDGLWRSIGPAMAPTPLIDHSTSS